MSRRVGQARTSTAAPIRTNLPRSGPSTGKRRMATVAKRKETNDMRNTHVRGFARLALGLLAVVSTSALADVKEQSFPAEARKRLDYTIGKWRSKTESLDKKGNVVKTGYSTTERRFAIEDRVVAISGVIEADGSTFRAWEYYDVKEKKYTITSVDRDGQLFSMKGDLGDEFVWQGIRKRPDGSTMIMKFTHSDITENSFSALGELSMDGGKTWRAFTRQSLTRIDE